MNRIYLGTGFFLLSLTLSCAGVALPRETIRDPGALLFNGYANPNSNCYRCHNGDGTGKMLRGSNLAKAVPKMNDAQIRETILRGKGIIMPAFENKLDVAEIDQLTAWLKQAFPGATP